MSQRTTGQISAVVPLTANVEKEIIKIKGPGENLFLLIFNDGDYQMRYTILIDNVPLAYGRFRYIQPSFIATYQGNPEVAGSLPRVGGPGIWLAQYDTTNDNYGIIINLALKWKVSLVIKAKTSLADQSVQASMIYDKLEEIPSLDIPKEDIQQIFPKDPRM